MQERPNYYAVIPATVRYDKRLKANEKLLYGEITSLTNKTGECWATSQYFADLYEVSIRSVRRWISNLVKTNYINIKILNESERYITLVDDKNVLVVGQNCHRGEDKNVLHNNKYNNKSNKKEIDKERKPTLEEVENYCKERNNNVDPKKFYDYYSVNNWIDNKGNKVKNWKQKIITWENHSPDNIELPSWFNKDIKASATDEEQEEMKNILKEFK